VWCVLREGQHQELYGHNQFEVALWIKEQWLNIWEENNNELLEKKIGWVKREKDKVTKLPCEPSIIICNS